MGFGMLSANVRDWKQAKMHVHVCIRFCQCMSGQILVSGMYIFWYIKPKLVWSVDHAMPCLS